ncbi:MAG: RagB/SusD family nutrient uptake outer membrane protein [Muribaculaceae bacterium]|nr:RagB/SusD family nutrient uptake outer membrane protein [Muribaculaceae bacterium]
MKISKIFWVCGAAAALCMQSCSLDEINPGGFTMETLATDPAGYETLLNQCYFSLERKFYNDFEFMNLTEANTDLWTAKTNQLGEDDKYFKFFAGADPDKTFTTTYWNAAYDGIGACNFAIRTAPGCSFKNDAERQEKIAQARFLRAVYYYHIVETFGGVVYLDETMTEIDNAPTRTAPIDIYRDLIIPDLRFAVDNLNVGTYASDAVPTKKSALGFLAKACLATQQYGTTEFLQEGYEAAQALISDCESGGSKYLAYMYPTFDEVFKEDNNRENKEALWKYSLFANSDGYGCSNGNFKLNRNDEHFLCQLNHFGARLDNQESRLSWDGGVQGDFMPTQHLLNLFVQEDGSLDPRFHSSFITEWKANQEYAWTAEELKKYDKSTDLDGQKINIGDLAIRFIMPQDASYASEVAGKSTSNYLLIDYKDVYDNAKKEIVMMKGSGENNFRYFYPSLNKHASTHYFVANANKMRNGNLNTILAMRMSEIYLIAAEYDILLNGGGSAMNYINKVRTRAGAKPLSGAATIRTVLDERGRELCGEFTRFYDLKRTGMFKDAAYLQGTFPELAEYFKPEYALRPIPKDYTDVIQSGADFVNPGY